MYAACFIPGLQNTSHNGEVRTVAFINLYYTLHHLFYMYYNIRPYYFQYKNTFFIKLYKICERLFSRIKLPDGNKKAAIPMLRGIYRPASALLLLYFILLLLYYLVARISFIWLTSPPQSIPCTMHASSRLSPWADGHPRQCIPARISIWGINSSILTN